MADDVDDETSPKKPQSAIIRGGIRLIRDHPTCGTVFWCSGLILFIACGIGFIAGLGALLTRVVTPTPLVIPPPSNITDPPPSPLLFSPRRFTGIESPARATDAISTSSCSSLYAMSCGNFTADKYSRNDQMMTRVQTTNDHIADLIEYWIKTSHNGELSSAGGNGHAMSKFYQACELNRASDSHLIDVATGTLIAQLRAIGNIYDKLRFMVSRGMLSYVQITKDRTVQQSFFHYIRPGGVLTVSEMELDLAPLFGGGAPARSFATNMTVSDFLARAGPNWRKVLDPNAQLYDTAVVENIDYFIRLASLIVTNPAKVTARLELFVTQTLAHLQSMSCMDRTFLMYPMTTCDLFRKTSLGLNDDSPDPVLDQLSADILQIVKEMFFADETATLRVQRCSSIFHSDNIGQILLQKETQREELNLANETHVGWMVDTMRTLATYYNPVYLYYSYPRVLDASDVFLDDPLRWWAQTNAWYDWFRNLVVVPIGFCIFPLWHGKFSLEQMVQMAFILGHEFVHSYQDRDQAPMECCAKYLSATRCSSDRRFELYSDVVGLRIAFEYYRRKSGEVVYGQKLQEFLFYFGQMFCSLSPSVDPDGVHGSAMERVDIPWKELAIPTFAGCKPAPQCGV